MRQAMFMGDQTKSLRAARLWTEVAPEDLTARQFYGALLMRAGQTDRAVRQFEFLLSRDDSPESFDMMSELLSRGRDRNTAYDAMGRPGPGPRGQPSRVIRVCAHGGPCR